MCIHDLKFEMRQESVIKFMKYTEKTSNAQYVFISFKFALRKALSYQYLIISTFKNLNNVRSHLYHKFVLNTGALRDIDEICIKMSFHT